MSCQATEITAAGPTRDPLNLLRQMPDAVRKNAHLTPPDMIPAYSPKSDRSGCVRLKAL